MYPQALLIWTIGITYSIITPLILPFATLYFGLAYFVYKYRFLFVFCKCSSASRGISGVRLLAMYLQIDLTRVGGRRGRSRTTASASA